MTATDPATLLTAIDEARDSHDLIREIDEVMAAIQPHLTGWYRRWYDPLFMRAFGTLTRCRAELVRHTGIVVTYPAPVGWHDQESDAMTDDDTAALAAAARKGSRTHGNSNVGH